MFIVFPLSFINKVTQSIDTDASATEGPDIHLAVSRATDQGLLESGTDPQIKDVPPKREEEGESVPMLCSLCQGIRRTRRRFR